MSLAMDMNLLRRSTMKKTIIIIDDEWAIRDALHLALLGKFEILEAADGQQGVQLIEKLRNAKKDFDLLILDLNLPHLAGQGLLAWMKLESLAHKPVLIVTGQSPLPADKDFNWHGPIEIMGKPFEAADLLITLGRLIKDGRSGAP